MRKFTSIFSDMPISFKLFLSYSCVFVITILLGSAVIYSLMRHSIEDNIESELKNTTNAILNMVRTAAGTSIKNHLRAVAEHNREIVELIYKKYKKGLMTEHEAKAFARDILLSQTIGKSGYLYIVESSGYAPVHPKPDVEGNYYLQHEFVREQIRRKEGYLEYEWKNPGDKHKRPKALYMSYFEPWDWIISVSAYRKEFAHLIKVSDFRDSILALRFGQTGYSFVLNSKGDLITHPMLKGNFLNVTDTHGKQFVRKICSMKKGKMIYSWKNPGEKAFRDKLVIFNYIPEYDWIVASSCYLEEIYAPLNSLRNTVVVIVLATLMLVIPLTLVISGSIVRPLKALRNRFAIAKRGDFSVRMNIASKDEVGELATYFNVFMEKLENYRDKLLAEVYERKQTEEALRDSEGKYRGILERMQEGYYEFDLDGNFIFYNDALALILGYSGDELMDVNIREITDQATAEDISKTFNIIMENRSVAKDAGCELFRKDGSVCSVEASISLIESKGGLPIGFRGVLRDITERKKSEEALRLSEEVFSKAFRCSPSGMIIATMQAGTVVNVNDSFLRFTGYSLSEVKGRSLLDPRFLLDDMMGAALLKKIRQRGRVTDQEITFYTMTSESRSGIVSAELVELWGEECILVALQDVTDSKRLEREILEVSEREHQKIGRDLHDDVCPHLIGIEVLSNVLARKLNLQSLDEVKDALKIQSLIQDSIRKLRRLSRGLCPVDLDEGGFDSSVASLGLYIEEIFGVSYHFKCDMPVKIGDHTVATHLYYIAHEAVHNAAKHSQAKNIFVTLSSVNGMIELHIRDDGRGIMNDNPAKGMGLRIMKYRARRIGAAFEINNNETGGTSVTVRLESAQYPDRPNITVPQRLSTG